MKELSLNILDISENSVSANASSIDISIEENVEEDLLRIIIKDDGHGMEDKFLKEVTNPFITTRTTRKVGMGIPLFKEAAEATGGRFKIQSKRNVGTTVEAVFGYSHIDRAPLGDMGETISTLIQCHPDIKLNYSHSYGGRVFSFSTEEIKLALEGVPLNNPEIVLWIKEYINEKIRDLNGGVSL